MLRKHSQYRICWTEEKSEIDQCLKELIKDLGEAVLQASINENEFIVEGDASKYAIGVVLSSKTEYEAVLEKSNRKERLIPISFFSKKFSAVEERWPIYEKEAYIMVKGLELCDAWLKGRLIEIRSDHQSLKWLSKAKSGKLARWETRLAEYKVRICYVSGAQNPIADFLSRWIHSDDLWREEKMPFPSAKMQDKREELGMMNEIDKQS